jgi:L,D-peptidoglycan transpeptidase YkuD (ErfK/YbiS/YcfS/YnhG family)
MRRFVTPLLALALSSAAILATGSTASSAPIDRGGHAVRSAVRGVPTRPGASCDLATVTALAARHPAVRQFIVLATADFNTTSGTAFAAVRRTDGTWACQTDALMARFGRTGTRPLADRRSGDGTTPAGVFPLGTATAWDGQRFSVFGNASNPDVRSTVTYRQVRPQDCWGATANTPAYNHLVNLPNCAGPDDEWLPRFGDVYSHAAVIGANLDPVSGDAPGETPYAAAIFLHRHSSTDSGASKPTSGCVSLEYADLVDVLRLLDPSLQPHFAIGPTAWLRSTA